MIDPRLFEEFRDIGRDIYLAGLTFSHVGNLSVRVGHCLLIKRRASAELMFHRTIYQRTFALAVIPCPPRTAIALSLSRDEIIPIDGEGSYRLRPTASGELPPPRPIACSQAVPCADGSGASRAWLSPPLLLPGVPRGEARSGRAEGRGGAR